MRRYHRSIVPVIVTPSTSTDRAMPKSVIFACPSSLSDVLRLHVAVDEPPVVRERERSGHLDREQKRVADG